MHIIGAIKEIKMIKQKPTQYRESGFLFIDFQQAFDSVNHKILLKKIDQHMYASKEWQ